MQAASSLSNMMAYGSRLTALLAAHCLSRISAMPDQRWHNQGALQQVLLIFAGAGIASVTRRASQHQSRTQKVQPRLLLIRDGTSSMHSTNDQEAIELLADSCWPRWPPKQASPLPLQLPAGAQVLHAAAAGDSHKLEWEQPHGVVGIGFSLYVPSLLGLLSRCCILRIGKDIATRLAHLAVNYWADVCWIQAASTPA